jgi:superfamily II DNA or RNA helicase
MDVLILAGGGKSSIQLTQRIGRVLRKTSTKSHAKVYDFVDTTKYLDKHYKQRRELLSSEFEVIEYD